MVISNENLRQLCIKNNWFTCGTCEQYEKLFHANRLGMNFEGLATIIWVCSEGWTRKSIIEELEKLEREW